MLPSQRDAPKGQAYRRSPLLVAAYATLGGAVALMLLGSGLFWTVGTATMAVLLAIGEIVVQVRRRSRSA
jgi:hypothetical protein